MNFKDLKNIRDLLDTVTLIISSRLGSKNMKEAIKDCKDAINIIINTLSKLEKVPKRTLDKLEIIKINLERMIFNSDKHSIMDLISSIVDVKESLNIEVNIKIKVAFMPYKLSMWDSLETVYQAAKEDPNCDVKIVPIPYYELDGKANKSCYEGERFDKDLDIINYKDYNLREERPDIIFIHNMYDQYNTITQVYEEYFTDNLKKYTDMLVFVPYHIASVIKHSDIMDISYNLPSIKNVDKIILTGEDSKKSAIKSGLPEEKFLVLGSPKFDRIIRAKKQGVNLPKEWTYKIKDKMVFLLNTGVMFFVEDRYFKTSLLADFLNIPNIIENAVLIWRPHPLTKASIERYTPDLLEYYTTLTDLYIKKELKYDRVILDETDDYIPALVTADALITGESSLLSSYLITGNSVFFYHRKSPKDKNFMKSQKIPTDSFYYIYDEEKTWIDVAKDLSRGQDNLRDKRIEYLKETYPNISGNSGEEVYKTIRENLLEI